MYNFFDYSYFSTILIINKINNNLDIKDLKTARPQRARQSSVKTFHFRPIFLYLCNTNKTIEKCFPES